MKRHKSFRILMLVAASIFITSTIWAPSAALAATSPIHIRFATGATSATASGSLAANGAARYVLYAGISQLMDVTLSAPEGQA